MTIKKTNDAQSVISFNSCATRERHVDHNEKLIARMTTMMGQCWSFKQRDITVIH